jgi:hypothetical protein
MTLRKSLQCPFCGKQAISHLKLGFSGVASRLHCASCGKALKVAAWPLTITLVIGSLAFPAGMVAAWMLAGSGTPGSLALIGIAGGILASLPPLVLYHFVARLKPRG